MREPVVWSALLVLSAAGVGARLLARRPLLAGAAIPLRRFEAALAGACLLALAFHCLAMFFASWIDLVPPLRAPAAAVRAMGTTSELAYWIPAGLLGVAVRRVRVEALLLLTVTLIGVGVTMFWPFALQTHLAWIFAAVSAVVLIFSSLVSGWTVPAE